MYQDGGPSLTLDNLDSRLQRQTDLQIFLLLEIGHRRPQNVALLKGGQMFRAGPEYMHTHGDSNGGTFFAPEARIIKTRPSIKS